MSARLVLVSHRVPVSTAEPAPSGLVTTLLPGARARGALWMGWSGRCVDAGARRLTLRHGDGIDCALLDLTAHELRHHYAGFCNQTLWPLLHALPGPVRADAEDWRVYRAVNQAFARHLAALLRPGDRIWIHDYHLFFLAAELRALRVQNRIGFFLHTPFPPPKAWRVLPQSAALARALRACDLVGVQTAGDKERLRACLDEPDRATGAEGAPPMLGVFPASIDTPAVARAAASSASDGALAGMAGALERGSWILGIDRLDPAKGIDRRLAGFERFLVRHPRWRGAASLLQVLPDSRAGVPGYAALRMRLNAQAAAINQRHRESGWSPVHTIARPLDRPALLQICRRARVALLTPLRDGMNLVAKEYVAAQDARDPGVLILSRHAGAAHELSGAVLIDPEDADGVASAVAQALAMSLAERRERWQGMWRHLLAHDALAWHARFLDALESAPAAGHCCAAAPANMARLIHRDQCHAP